MSRYINTDELVRYFENEIRLMENDGASPFSLALANGVINDIERQPSIDIVFCAECRDCVEKGVGIDCPSGYGYLYCKQRCRVVNEDDYCSWGERR